MTAARTGIAAAVKTLLAHGADVNAKESWRGQTALMWAAAEGHAEALQVLLEAGAQVNARSSAGWTALLFAAREGRIAGGQALLAGGADVNDALLGRRGRARAVAPASALVAASGRRQAGRARSCSPSAARTSSSPRRCSTPAPTRTPPRRDGPRSITSPGSASRAPAATIPRPTARATWTA